MVDRSVAARGKRQVGDFRQEKGNERQSGERSLMGFYGKVGERSLERNVLRGGGLGLLIRGSASKGSI